jgi:ABC-type Na+ efflux pump permease subunit
MNIQLKTIILKEIRTLQSKKNLVSFFLYVVITSFMMYFICKNLTISKFNILITQSIIQGLIIFLITSGMFTFMMQFLIGINIEKSSKILESMLISPISLSKIIHGKVIALSIAYYMIIVSTIMILGLILRFFFMLNILQLLKLETWFVILVLIPIFFLLYSSAIIWGTLRFNSNINLIFSVLNCSMFFILFGIIYLMKSLNLLSFLSKGISNGNLITHPILFYFILILLIMFIIVYILIKKLNKEKVIIN